MKIFLSHSHDDAKLVEKVQEFLIMGIGIKHEDIFCSSTPGKGVPIGANFIDHISAQIRDESMIVIAFVTNNYFNSKFCLYELGACWGLTKNIIPLLGPRMNFAMFDGFFANRICISITKESDLNKLIDDLENKYIPEKVPTQVKNNSVKKIISEIKALDVLLASTRNNYKGKSLTVERNYKYKVVAFDFDGTLLQSTKPEFGDAFHYSWKEVWAHLGYDDKIRKSLYTQHKNDPASYSYQQWCDECGEYFIEKKFHRDTIKEIISQKKLKLADGLYTTLMGLKKAGFDLYIISGGINTFYELGMPQEIRNLFTKVFINKFEYDISSGFLKKITPYQHKESDFIGKVNALKEACQISKCDISEAVFIGEGTNDIDVATSGCFSIAYPPTATQDFKDIADYVTDDMNIATILPYILIPKSAPKTINKK